MVMECKVTARKSHYPKEGPWELPEGWAWCRLDELGEVITGTTPSKGDTSNYGNDYPFYKPTDLENGINTTLAGDNLSAEGYEKARKLPINSVLVTCIGATIGKTGLIRRAGSCNQQINAVIPLPFVVPEYLYYCCVSGYGQDAIISNASATTLPILNKSRFSELLFPLPPIQEQQRILEAINHYMAIIEGVDDKRIKLIKLSDASKTKILDLAIHGKLVPQDHSDEPAIELLKRINPNFKPSDNLHYEDIPQSWTVCRLSDVCVDFIVPQRDKPKIFDGDIPWCRIEDIEGKYLNGSLSGRLVSKKTIQQMNMRICPVGTVICSCSASIGTQAIVTQPCCTNQTFIGLVPDDRFIYNEFLYYFLASQTEQFLDIGTGTTIKYISREKFEEYRIPLPPLVEQRRIVERIEYCFLLLKQIQSATSIC